MQNRQTTEYSPQTYPKKSDPHNKNDLKIYETSTGKTVPLHKSGKL